MLRIAHIADLDFQQPIKKDAKQEQLERCMMMLANQKVADKIKAKKMFAERRKANQEKILILEKKLAEVTSSSQNKCNR